MGTFEFGRRPPVPLENVTSATTEEIQARPDLYFQSGDLVWVLMSSGLVFLMIPGISLFYSGAGDRRAALTLFKLPLLSAAFVGFQWFVWGYCLAFTPGFRWWGSTASSVVLRDIVSPRGAGPKIPQLLYALFHGMFASFTATLVTGGTMLRVRPARFIIFITLWEILVYIPMARSTWYEGGFYEGRDILDFAGGSPVHITSGTTVAAFVFFVHNGARGLRVITKTTTAIGNIFRWYMESLGLVWSTFHNILVIFGCVGARKVTKDTEATPPGGDGRRNHDGRAPSSASGLRPGRIHTTEDASPPARHPSSGRGTSPMRYGEHRPHNTTNMILGTGLLWLGWFGFNGGSALGGNMRAVSACVSTHVAACAGGVANQLLAWLSSSRGTLSVTGFCDGVMIGLVTITPASGYVPAWSAAVFGIVGVIGVNIIKRHIKHAVGPKGDPLAIFSIHAGGGAIGMLLLAAFFDETTIGLDGYSRLKYPDRSRLGQFANQLLDVVVTTTYSFVVTIGILILMTFVRSLFVWVFRARDVNGKRAWKWDTGLDATRALEDNPQAASQYAA